MRKTVMTMITGIAVLILLNTCKQFSADIDKDLSYWASQASIRKVVLPEPIKDTEEVFCISSSQDKELIFDVANHKNFTFKLPGQQGAPQDILVFGDGITGIAGGTPVAGTDYEMKQVGSSVLKLTLKKAFLEKYEYGEPTIAPVITLYNKEGRKFTQTYTFQFRVNTPPPALDYKAVGKIQDSGRWYYVLCFQVPAAEMSKRVRAGLLHKDIVQLLLTEQGGNRREIAVKVNNAATDFDISSSAGLLVAASGVSSLAGTDYLPGFTPGTPPAASDKWVLCLKTDVEVRVGGTKHYTVQLRDAKGLVSAERTASTPENTAVNVAITLDEATGMTTAGTIGQPNAPSNRYEIKNKANAPNIILNASTTTAGATIKYKLNGGSEQSGAAISLPVPAAGSTDYTLEVWAEKPGLNASAHKTIYYKVTKVATINGSDSGAWAQLKQAVEDTNGPAEIIINGIVQAQATNQQIQVKRAVTIKGTNKNSDILDADGKCFIFHVWSSGGLTLENLTLQNGKQTGTSVDGGGAIYCAGGTLTAKSITISNCTAKKGGGIYANNNTTVTMTGCTLTGNQAITNNDSSGGAVYAKGATVTMENCNLKGNQAKENGGAVCAEKDGTTPADITIKGGTIGGDGTNGNEATNLYSFGGGIYVNDGCSLTLERVYITGNKAGRAGGIRANRSTVKITSCTITENRAEGSQVDSGGGGVYTNGGTLDMTDCILTGNKAETNGGGMTIENTTVTIKDCTLTGNTANNNGGGMNIENTTVIMKDCTLTGNTANNNGGGVYVRDGTFKMSGTSCITPSTSPNENAKGKNEVFLKTGTKITVTGSLTGSSPIGRITPETYAAGTQVVEAENGVSIGDVTNKFTVTPQTTPAKNWIIDKGGCLRDFDGIGKDVIAAFDGDMSNKTIKKYNEMIGHFIFYKTSSGNYGVLTITATPLYAADAYEMKFSYKTYDANGLVLKEGEETVTGTYSFDLDTGTTGSATSTGVDFFLHNSIDIDPKNNARFFTQNPPQ